METQGAHFHIDSDKLAEVTALVGEADAREATIDYDWANADQHQEWLDSATAQEIADWVIGITEEPANA